MNDFDIPIFKNRMNYIRRCMNILKVFRGKIGILWG